MRLSVFVGMDYMASTGMHSQSHEPALVIDDVVKRFGRGNEIVTAVDHMSFTVKQASLFLLSARPVAANPLCSTSSAACSAIMKVP